MDRFKKLSSGEINWSNSIREYVKEREKKDICIYCGKRIDLTLEHILPRSRGGPDTTENAVFVCKSCNSSKGDKRLYEWFGLENRYKVPRIAEGKYLKLLHGLHKRKGTLNLADVSKLCPRCDLRPKCPEKQKLTIYCLEGICTKA
ncbi:MAG: HNH endonuclease [Candidatus Bathyarchaeota archaeon]|nr:HNH endonuclease [Candidatus Bathyarchaeota archaeon]